MPIFHPAYFTSEIILRASAASHPRVLQFRQSAEVTSTRISSRQTILDRCVFPAGVKEADAALCVADGADAELPPEHVDGLSEWIDRPQGAEGREEENLSLF
jgi:hypothetical protein